MTSFQVLEIKFLSLSSSHTLNMLSWIMLHTFSLIIFSPDGTLASVLEMKALKPDIQVVAVELKNTEQEHKSIVHVINFLQLLK